MATKPARRPSFCGSIFSFSGITIRGDSLIRCGDAERFHFAVPVAALEAQSRRGLRHVPAVFLQLAQNKFALVSAARFVQRGVRMLRAFRHSPKNRRRAMVRSDPPLLATHNSS